MKTERSLAINKACHIKIARVDGALLKLSEMQSKRLDPKFQINRETQRYNSEF